MSSDLPARQVDVNEARALLVAGEATALDVREPYEWEAGRLPGSLWIPHGRARRPAARAARRPARGGVPVGVAQRHVADALAARGYDARNLAGGLCCGQQAGLPLEPEGGTVA